MFENLNNVDDLLGVVIGFSTIMLLLSLVVMAIVQFIQNSLHIRFRNLKNGLNHFVKSLNLDSDKENDKGNVADKILNWPFNEKISNDYKKGNIDPDEIVEILKDLFGKEKIQHIEEQIKHKYEVITGYVKHKVTTHIRYISLLVAVLVAFSFQVDSLGLLQKLSTDVDFRNKLEMTANSMIENENELIPNYLSYQDVSDSALILLHKKYPEIAPQLEQVSGMGENKKDILQELDDVLSSNNVSNTAEVKDTYNDYMTDLFEEEAAKSRAQFDKVTGQLAFFNIKPFQYGISFYNSLNHIIGMLLTAIFLTMGAPFWYNRMKDAINLKNLMKRTKITPPEK